VHLEELLYNSRYQIDDITFESSKFREYSILYKQQLNILRQRFGDLEADILMLYTENR
jgi:hypothetical protein